jgi:hypothetical protein
MLFKQFVNHFLLEFLQKETKTVSSVALSRGKEEGLNKSYKERKKTGKRFISWVGPKC